MIEVKNLTVREKKRCILDHVNFKFNNGHTYGIFGPHGSGKTALLDQLAGCRFPSEGSVSINGFDPTREPLQAKRLVGYMPQGEVVYPSMTPMEYLLFVAEAREMDYEKSVRRVSALLNQAGLSAKKASLIQTLSSFERRCISLLQAALNTSGILLLDDPTANLTPWEAQKLTAILQSLSASATVIISGCNLQKLRDTCERVLILSNGILINDGLQNDVLPSNKADTGKNQEVPTNADHL